MRELGLSRTGFPVVRGERLREQVKGLSGVALADEGLGKADCDEGLCIGRAGGVGESFSKMKLGDFPEPGGKRVGPFLQKRVRALPQQGGLLDEQEYGKISPRLHRTARG